MDGMEELSTDMDSEIEASMKEDQENEPDGMKGIGIKKLDDLSSLSERGSPPDLLLPNRGKVRKQPLVYGKKLARKFGWRENGGLGSSAARGFSSQMIASASGARVRDGRGSDNWPNERPAKRIKRFGTPSSSESELSGNIHSKDSPTSSTKSHSDSNLRSTVLIGKRRRSISNSSSDTSHLPFRHGNNEGGTEAIPTSPEDNSSNSTASLSSAQSGRIYFRTVPSFKGGVSTDGESFDDGDGSDDDPDDWGIVLPASDESSGEDAREHELDDIKIQSPNRRSLGSNATSIELVETDAGDPQVTDNLPKEDSIPGQFPKRLRSSRSDSGVSSEKLQNVSTSIPPEYESPNSIAHSGSFQTEDSQLKEIIENPGAHKDVQGNSFTEIYLNLLNTEFCLASTQKVYDIASPSLEDPDTIEPVLGSLWTLKEKEMFFEGLTLVGRGRVDLIAKSVETKSVLECQAYLNALQDGYVKAQTGLPSSSNQLLGMKDIPAAVELSNECIRALEKHASILRNREEMEYYLNGNIYWGEHWVFDSKLASHIQELYDSDNIAELEAIAPQAELLNIRTMLELSERIFMNGPGEYNFRSISNSGESPSIDCQALLDFHSLVMNLTQRLTQTTIFITESRLRSKDSAIFNAQPIVKVADVAAAVEILGMPANGRDYFTKLARRIGINVSDYLTPLSYDDVEERLARETGGISGCRYGKVSDASLSLPLSSPSPSSMHDVEKNDQDDSEEVDLGVSRDDEEFYLKEDKYLEVFDHQQSFKVENEFWKMMENESTEREDETTSSVENDRDAQESKLSPPSSKSTLDQHAKSILNWREKLEYQASWEYKTFGYPHISRSDESYNSSPKATTNKKPKQILRKQIPKKRKASNEIPRLNKPLKNPPKNLEKKLKTVPSSPRNLRTRRKSSLRDGFVSTAEVVSMENEEGLLGELDNNQGNKQDGVEVGALRGHLSVESSVSEYEDR